MTADKALTAKELAEILGVTKQAIMKRAKKESWQGVNGNGRGGNHLKYPLPSLPQDVQLAIYHEEGAPAAMLPALAPAVALAAMERQAEAPSFAETVRPTMRAVRCRRRTASRVGSLLPEESPAAPSHNNKDTGGGAKASGRQLEQECGRQNQSTPTDRNGHDQTCPALLHNNKDTTRGAAGKDILRAEPDCTPRSISAPPAATLQNCALEPARRYSFEELPAWSPERAISAEALKNPRVARILAILREVEAMPAGFAQGKDAWIRYVAAKHDVARGSVYRWIDKYDKRGIAGLEHRKSSQGRPKAWTPEALDFWIGLCLKPSQRKMDLRALYEDALILEAQRRAWSIGGYDDAVWWFRKKASPLMLAMQKGGLRAVDNLLPPVLRDYSDLAPFEMLVGDQHRFDFWVVDDDSGAVFRPECYLWQDLRTRILYGAAFDRHYDAHLCGLALRYGMRIWGLFTSIYTDNGSSEISRYMMGILSEIRALGAEWNLTLETPLDVLDTDPEDVNPVVQPISPGTHKRAVVKNAKAKMIEKTFDIIEEILRGRFRVPGSVKRLSDDIHAQDVDHQEALRLAAQGKLLLASEFFFTVYRALDYYNREKTHRGVRREWAWKPVPAAVTPMDCLKACYADGWRPRAISDEAADMVFLRRIRRTVQLGRITIDREVYEHDALLELAPGSPVECRANPLEQDAILVYVDGKFLCAAHPVEYSSMKDNDLARRKILEKRAKRKAIAERFRAMIKNIPDLREYSRVPEAEKVAALVGEERKRQEAVRKNLARPQSAEELAAGIEKLERLNELMPDGTTRAFATAVLKAGGKKAQARPDFWTSAADRFLWCVQAEAAGGELTAEDQAFVQEQEAAMTPEARERWQFEREYGT